MAEKTGVEEVVRGVRDDMSPEIIVSWRDKIDEEKPVVDKAIAQAIACAAGLDRSIKQQTKMLQTMKDRIAIFAAEQQAPAKTVNLEVEGATCKVIFKDDRVVITDAGELRDILGRKRFEDLVEVVTDYNPSDKLKEMAVDADHKLADKLRQVLAVKPTAPAFSFNEKQP